MLNIANKEGYKWGEVGYIIGNEFGTLCISYAANESDALDNAVNEGLMDQQLMSEEDHSEYESNGWDDSYCLLGNASEPFWSENLWIKPALGRVKQAYVPI
jgi:hypothetical protein